MLFGGAACVRVSAYYTVYVCVIVRECVCVIVREHVCVIVREHVCMCVCVHDACMCCVYTGRASDSQSWCPAHLYSQGLYI